MGAGFYHRISSVTANTLLHLHRLSMDQRHSLGRQNTSTATVLKRLRPMTAGRRKKATRQKCACRSVGSRTSHKVFLQVIDDLVVVADDGVAVEEDGHLLAQVQPHEPRLLVLLQRQAHVPLLADQTLLVDD